MANTGSDEDKIDFEESEDDSRELGVEFGELEAELETHEYPTTVDELVDEYGDREIELSGGEESFREVLGPYTEEPDQQFNDPDEVRQAVLNMVGSDAVGETGYSDRGIEDDENTESF